MLYAYIPTAWARKDSQNTLFIYEKFFRRESLDELPIAFAPSVVLGATKELPIAFALPVFFFRRESLDELPIAFAPSVFF